MSRARNVLPHGAVGAAMTLHRIEFGPGLVGHLHLPEQVPVGTRAPAVALTGPLTGVKEQVTGRYAAELASRGIVALAFDHRGWGESGGERRQHEDPFAKLDDLRAAVTYLASRTDVDADRLGVLGICLGGGYALRAAAADPRVSRVATVAGAYNSPAAFREAMGPERYREVLADFARQVTESDGAASIAAVAVDGPAAMGGQEPFDYYGTDRSASPHWRNELTVESLWNLMTLDTLSAADLLAPVPLRIVHGRTDAYCSPEGAQAAYDRASGPKDIVWLDTTNHIDLYDVDEFVIPAVESVAEHFAAA